MPNKLPYVLVVMAIFLSVITVSLLKQTDTESEIPFSATTTDSAATIPESKIIGMSVEGRPIVSHQFGTGQEKYY